MRADNENPSDASDASASGASPAPGPLDTRVLEEATPKPLVLRAVLLDGKGGGRALDETELAAWTPEQGKLWVHLNGRDKGADRWLTKAGLEKLAVDALLAEETRPRSLAFQGSVLVILRGVNLNAGRSPEDMVSLRVWLEEDRVITIQRQPLKSVARVASRIKRGKGSLAPSDLLVDVVYELVDFIADVMNDVDESMDELEEAVINAESLESRGDLLRLRQKTIALKRHLTPQRDVLSRLPMERARVLNDADRQHLREIADQTARLVEYLDEIRERAAIAQDELSARINERMGRNTYVLSVIAAIFLPLGLLTGLLGINVGGIPGAEAPYSFALVCLMLIVIGFLQYLLYRKLRWI